MITFIIIVFILVATCPDRYVLTNEADDAAIIEQLEQMEKEEKEFEAKLELYDLYSDIEYMGGFVSQKYYHLTKKTKTKKEKAAKAKSPSFKQELIDEAIVQAEEARQLAIKKDLKKIHKRNNRAEKDACGGSYITYELHEACKSCPSFTVCDRLYKLNIVNPAK